ncbi:unnamed protein product [Ascophyllum nodosum]
MVAALVWAVQRADKIAGLAAAIETARVAGAFSELEETCQIHVAGLISYVGVLNDCWEGGSTPDPVALAIGVIKTLLGSAAEGDRERKGEGEGENWLSLMGHRRCGARAGRVVCRRRVGTRRAVHAAHFRRVRRPASRCRPGGPFEAGGSWARPRRPPTRRGPRVVVGYSERVLRGGDGHEEDGGLDGLVPSRRERARRRSRHRRKAFFS